MPLLGEPAREDSPDFPEHERHSVIDPRLILTLAAGLLLLLSGLTSGRPSPSDSVRGGADSKDTLPRDV